MIKDEKRKIFLIVDNLRDHKSKLVTAWAQDHTDRIELFFLPLYRPEINPDEYVNHALKTDIRIRAPAEIGSLKKRTQRFMSKMANSARKMLKTFEIEQVRYAAAIC